MGSEFSAICNKCGRKFQVLDGGGFFFHLLHCDKCGRHKQIGFDRLGEAHLAYIKGLAGPYAIATSQHDKQIQDEYPGAPLSQAEYDAAVEDIAGKCKCGGRFRMDAPARCPKCASTDFRQDEDGISCCYD
jgi:hypothetical protein